MQNLVDVLYVAPLGYAMDIKDMGAFLSAKNSDGILTRCDYLPPFMLERAIKIDGMCSVSSSALIGKLVEQ